MDVSSSIRNHTVSGSRQPFIPLLWSPDVTKLAVQLEKSIVIIDVTKPAGVARYNGFSPSLQSWTPDSQRIVVADVPHISGMDPIVMNERPSFYSLEVYATDGRIGESHFLTRNAIPRFQISRLAWRSDGERLLAGDNFGGIWIISANGSDRRPILRGSQPTWVQ